MVEGQGGLRKTWSIDKLLEAAGPQFAHKDGDWLVERMVSNGSTTACIRSAHCNRRATDTSRLCVHCSGLRTGRSSFRYTLKKINKEEVPVPAPTSITDKAARTEMKRHGKNLLGLLERMEKSEHTQGKSIGVTVSLAANMMTLAPSTSKTYRGKTTAAAEGMAMMVRSTGGEAIYNACCEPMAWNKERTTRRKIADLPVFKAGIHEDNFVIVAEILVGLIERRKLKGPFMCCLAEDETAFIPSIEFDIPTQTLCGACGDHCAEHHGTAKECKDVMCAPPHRCGMIAPYFCDESTDTLPKMGLYHAIKKIYDTRKAGTHLRLLMLNTLHPELPPLPLVLLPTCLVFDTDYVKDQWEEITKLYDQHIRPILGSPLQKGSSDGDSRRRKRQHALSASTRGIRYSLGGGDVEGFTLTGRWDGQSWDTISFCMDQDYYHCGRKLLNNTNHASRMIMWGTQGVVILSMLSEVFDAHGFLGCGFHYADLARFGYMAMDWHSLLRVVSPQSLHCTGQLINQGAPHLAGLLAYLVVIQKYVNMFISRNLTYKQRAEHAAYVVTSLRLQRLWVKHHESYNAKDNCPTLQSFKDILLSCHCIVLVMQIYGAHYQEQLPPPVANLGSNCDEDYFSSLGGWVTNRRTFTFLEALQTTRAIVRVWINTASSGVEPPRKNRRKKKEMKDDPEDEVGPDTGNWGPFFLVDLIQGWKNGIKKAYTAAERAGMKPRRRRMPHWWTHPHEYDPEPKGGDDEDDDDGWDDAGPPSANAEQSVNEGMVSVQQEAGCAEEDYNRGESKDNHDSEISTDTDCDDGTEDVEDGDDDGSDNDGQDDNVVLKSTLAKTKYSPTMYVPWSQKKENKVSVCKYLGGGGRKKISSDRVLRIMQASVNPAKNPTLRRDFDIEHDDWLLGPGANAAFLLKENNGRDQIYVGRVLCMRMTRKNGKGFKKTAWRRPVVVKGDRKNLEGLTFVCHWFVPSRTSLGNEFRGQNPLIFSTKGADPMLVPISALICPVAIHEHGKRGKQFIHTVDHTHWEYVQKNQKKTHAAAPAKRKPHEAKHTTEQIPWKKMAKQDTGSTGEERTQEAAKDTTRSRRIREAKTTGMSRTSKRQPPRDTKYIQSKRRPLR